MPLSTPSRVAIGYVAGTAAYAVPWLLLGYNAVAPPTAPAGPVLLGGFVLLVVGSVVAYAMGRQLREDRPQAAQRLMGSAPGAIVQPIIVGGAYVLLL